MVDQTWNVMTSPVFLTLVIVIGMVHEMVKQAIFGKTRFTNAEKAALPGWKKTLLIFYRATALVAGGLLGWGMQATGFTIPEAFAADGTGGAVMYGCLAGATAMIGYALIVSGIKEGLKVFGKKLAQGAE